MHREPRREAVAHYERAAALYDDPRERAAALASAVAARTLSIGRFDARDRDEDECVCSKPFTGEIGQFFTFDVSY